MTTKRSGALTRSKSGEVIYRSHLGTPRPVEVRASWDTTGNVRAIRFFYGDQFLAQSSMHLGHNERIRLAMGIAPELRVMVDEVSQFFEDYALLMDPDLDADTVELVKQIKSAGDEAS